MSPSVLLLHDRLQNSLHLAKLYTHWAATPISTSSRPLAPAPPPLWIWLLQTLQISGVMHYLSFRDWLVHSWMNPCFHLLAIENDAMSDVCKSLFKTNFLPLRYTYTHTWKWVAGSCHHAVSLCSGNSILFFLQWLYWSICPRPVFFFFFSRRTCVSAFSWDKVHLLKFRPGVVSPAVIVG